MAQSATIELTIGEVPENPPENQVVVYAKTDKQIYVKDSQGTETLLGTVE